MIIIEKEEEITYLSFKDDKMSGFTIKNGKVTNATENYIKDLQLLTLSSNYKCIKDESDTKILLDLESGLYHFFEKDSEDLVQFYLYNGKIATLFKGKNLNDLNFARVFTIKGKIKIIITSFALLLLLSGNYLSNHFKIIRFNDYNIGGLVVYDSTFENATFTSIGEATSYEKGITSESIHDAIYSSSNLNLAEKDFLWNEDLINDLVPYYQDTIYTDILIRIKHKDIDIVIFTEQEKQKYGQLGGFYNKDNLLHIRDYGPEVFEEDSISKLQIIAHEYIHLLEVNHVYSLITEAMSEILSYEYFFYGNPSFEYAYHDEVLITKALMEIIGPEAVREGIFKEGSTAIEDALEPYFSPSEFKEFLNLLKMNHDERGEEHYSRLRELLAILYKNKYNSNITENDMLFAILGDYDFSRIYFRKELNAIYPDYCETFDKIAIEEACENKKIVFYIKELITEEEYDQFDSSGLLRKEKKIIVNIGKRDLLDEFRIRIKDGDEIIYEGTIEEAEKQGYITIQYIGQREITPEEYIDKCQTQNPFDNGVGSVGYTSESNWHFASEFMQLIKETGIKYFPNIDETYSFSK